MTTRGQRDVRTVTEQLDDALAEWEGELRRLKAIEDEIERLVAWKRFDEMGAGGTTRGATR